MPLVNNAEPVRVELTTPGEWVDLKRRQSKGDQVRVQAAGLRMQMSQNGDITGVNIEATAEEVMESVTFLALEIGIVAWSFPEALTRENIRLLDPDDYALIVKAADELWSPRSDAEKKALSENGSTLSREKATSRKS